MANIVEVTDLCGGLNTALVASLHEAGGDSSRVVLVLDLDETAFTPTNPDGLGTSKWFEDIVARYAPRLERDEGMDFTATLKAVLDVVDVFYHHVDVAPTDSRLCTLLRECKSRGIATFGLTSRRPALATATWTQMGNRCDFEWNFKPPPELSRLEDEMRCVEHVQDPDLWDGLSFEKGVWFTSNANKGSLLKKVLIPGMHVVFADDSLRHLIAAQDALKGHAASLSCLHFTAATKAAEENLHAANCDLRMAAYVFDLLKSGDHSVRSLVEQKNLFVRHFMIDQGRPLGDTD
jgi:hypothetical protein